MPTASYPGFEHPLHYHDAGSGTPILFLNGLAGDHLYWMGQVRAFSREFRCLAFDNRDSGKSAYATAPYSIGDLADDIAWIAQSLHLPPAHVVGLSLGGMIAQELALRHPNQVRSLFLIGTLSRSDSWFMNTLDAFGLIRRQVVDSPAFFAAILPWLVSWRFFENPDWPDWLRTLLRQNPHPQRLDGFFRQLEAIRGHNTVDRLAEIRCPVLAAAGEDDMVCPARYARQLSAAITGSRLEILPRVGHAPPIEDPRTFNRLLREFIS
jgi:pimeloyl-ACP methyl ester carboxylesterase